MNGDDDDAGGNDDEMAKLITKKVDPFNINHKKNENLYKETLLEYIGQQPYKIVKNVNLPSFYVAQYIKKKLNLENKIQKHIPNSSS